MNIESIVSKLIEDKTTLIDEYRLKAIYDCCLEVENIDGDAAELGVYKGGSARLIAEVLPNKTVHLCDTFTGLPMTDRVGEMEPFTYNDAPLQSVKDYLKDLNNVIFHVGFFPYSLPGMLHEFTFSFVHFDGDYFRSCNDFINFFYPRMNPGGIMVFDDYDWYACPGIKEAVDDFFADKPEDVEVRVAFQCVVKLEQTFSCNP